MLKKILNFCCISKQEEDKPNNKITWSKKRFNKGIKYESKKTDTGISYYNSEIR